jgi:CheY-like chemotaxis protein
MLAVLVIEDDGPVRDILVSLVATALPQAQVEAVGSGAAALAAGLRHVPDVLVIDLGLPDMSGFETWRGLIAQGFCGRAIVATADDMPASRAQAAALGAAAYITKPFTARELRGVLAGLIPA